VQAGERGDNREDEAVRKLLADFADRVVDGAAVDADGDVARGRRALRRLRMRRRATVVLVGVAAAGVTVATGGPAAWMPGPGGDVVAHSPATDGDAAARRAAPRTEPYAGSATALPTVELATPMMGAASGLGVPLVRNASTWPGIACGLVPDGWQPRQARFGYVVLAPAAGTTPAGTLQLRVAGTADRLSKVIVVKRPGQLVFIGRYDATRRAAQLKQGDSWLILRMAGTAVTWSDDTVVRLLTSCSIPPVPTTR
jgi:hypothetical protein